MHLSAWLAKRGRRDVRAIGWPSARRGVPDVAGSASRKPYLAPERERALSLSRTVSRWCRRVDGQEVVAGDPPWRELVLDMQRAACGKEGDKRYSHLTQGKLYVIVI